jgi:hypothetical protein
MIDSSGVFDPDLAGHKPEDYSVFKEESILRTNPFCRLRAEAAFVVNIKL